MRSFTRDFLIAMCVMLMGYIFYIYYIAPFRVVEAATLDGQTTQVVPATQTVPPPTTIAPFFSREVQYWAGSILNWSALYGLDKNLIATVMQIESCGNPRAVSEAGAMGLFQVMPFHFNALENPYDPETNALRGLSYLNSSLGNGGGNARLALAGYNGGIGVIGRGEWTWSSETLRYVTYGYPIYADAAAGMSQSVAFGEWYASYGAGICRDASQVLGLN